MSERLTNLLEELSKWDRESAEVIELAIAYGECRESVLERMLVRRIEEALEPDDCCEDFCLAPAFEPIDDDCPDCTCDRDEDFDDDYADDYDEEDEEEEYELCDNGYEDDYYGYDDEDEEDDYDEEPEEDEPDELSERLGVDVESAAPLALAMAVVQKAGTDTLLQDKLILELSKRGKNAAQLTTLVEGL